MAEIVNRVANSKIITLDLEQYLPNENDIFRVDLLEGLYEGLILKEKEFRAWIKEISSTNTRPYVFLSNTSEGIIPNWAFMLASASFQANGATLYFEENNSGLEALILNTLQNELLPTLSESTLILKGCAKVDLSPTFYAAVTSLLLPHCKSLMFGEPCSTVPIYKAAKKA